MAGDPQHEHIPLSYDPRNYLIENGRHENIAYVPARDEGVSDDYLLRWYANKDMLWDYFGNGQEALARAQLHRTHLQMLQRLGDIAIPAHIDFIGNSPAGGGEVVIYTLVERLAEVKPVATRDDLRHLHTTLSKYFSWVVSTSEPAISIDFFKAEQYSAHQSPQLTLMDLDGYMVDTTKATLSTARKGLDDISTQIREM